LVKLFLKRELRLKIEELKSRGQKPEVRSQTSRKQEKMKKENERKSQITNNKLPVLCHP
jgi:hypothetical protein